MREIKFRAWDKENKCMKVVSELNFIYEKSQRMDWGMQGALNDVWLNSEDTSYVPVDTVLLQYTGLKDKNGKEIYEGDIIAESTLDKIIWDDSGMIIDRPYGKVYWCKNGYEVKLLHAGKVKILEDAKEFLKKNTDETGCTEVYMTTYDGVFQWPKDIEIIGNIYENPELIKEETK